MTKTQALAEYLSQLNSAETQWGIWVNPENIDEYRVGQSCFENGGMLDDWIGIGNLDQLSLGYQSRWDAFEECAEQVMGDTDFNMDALRDAYFGDGPLSLAEGLKGRLDAAIDSLCHQWSVEEADLFVEKLKDDIKAGVYAND